MRPECFQALIIRRALRIQPVALARQFIFMMNGGEDLEPETEDDGLCLPCAPSEDDVDLKNALFDEPIVGKGHVLMDENGPGAIEPNLSTPPPMTPAQWAKK